MLEEEMLRLIPPGSSAYYHAHRVKVGGVMFDGVERRYIGTFDDGTVFIVSDGLLTLECEEKTLPTIEEMSGCIPGAYQRLSGESKEN